MFTSRLRIVLSKDYRPEGKIWPWYTFLGVEILMTVLLLLFFGIADPNTYRTKLWLDGYMNGFNSSPTAALYAAANYRPYTAPRPYSQFITSYNVIISVLSMFMLLTKAVLFIVHCFPPILSLFAHAVLVALYAISIVWQAGSDMTDPENPQPGAPWYLTKSCSVSYYKTDVHYCEQAKAAFGCTCVAFIIFFLQVVYSAYSLWPTKQARALQSEKLQRQRSPYAEAAALSSDPSTARRSLFARFPGSPRSLAPFTPGTTGGLKSPAVTSQETWGTEASENHASALNSNPTKTKTSLKPNPFGSIQPMTPRTHAFNRLGGTKDLPLRNHFETSQPLRSPTFGLKSPLAAGFNLDDDVEKGNPNHQDREMKPIYFPPPPKVANKK